MTLPLTADNSLPPGQGGREAMGSEPEGGEICGVIAVVLLTMNQREKTLRCLDSFRTVEAPAFGIWLWDNGSTDGTAEAVTEAFPEVRYHQHPSNLGVASGRNRAAALAISAVQPAFLLFLDNDMTVTPSFLQALVAPFAYEPKLAQATAKIRDMADPRCLYGAGGCRIHFWRGDTSHVGYGEVDRGQYDRPAQCISSGGCMLVRSDIFQRLGGFDPSFDPYGPEDLDFGLRAREAGYHGLYVPEAVVFHETRPGHTFEGGRYTQKYAANRARQWFLFMRRHASLLEQVGFYFLGGPILLAGVVAREAKKGNLLGVLCGFWRGALAAFRSS